MERNRVICSDALTGLQGMPDNSVDCVITSPPYFNLRRYGDDPAEIGREKTPAEFVDNLVTIMREVRRVLKPTGTLWLNLGDSYGANHRWGTGVVGGSKQATNRGSREFQQPNETYKGDKNLLMIPALVALAMRTDGWILRAKAPWIQTNGMPESVDDRPTITTEEVFLFAKSSRYYYDITAVRKPNSEESMRRAMRGSSPQNKYAAGQHYPEGVHPNTMSKGRKRRGYEDMDEAIANGETALNPLGRNRRDTDWFFESLEAIRRDGTGMLVDDEGLPLGFIFPTQSNRFEHYAAYPAHLIEPMLLVSCPPKVCVACGKPYVRVVERSGVEPMTSSPSIHGEPRQQVERFRYININTTGWRRTCKCDTDDTLPGLVLDPFMGSGTTALVAVQHKRDYVGIELNPKYIPIIERRLRGGFSEDDKRRLIEGLQMPLFGETL